MKRYVTRRAGTLALARSSCMRTFAGSVRTSSLARLKGRLGLLALIVGLLHAPSPASAQQLPRWELTAGLVPRLMPIGSGLALQLGVNAAPSARWRWVYGAAYAREFESYGSCCGPNPGYSYQLETVEASGGIEFPLLIRPRGNLAVDGRVSPIWYHEIRRGYQEDFQPGPTSWHFKPAILSFGATGRASPSGSYQIGLRARAWLDLAWLPYEAPVRSSIAVIVGR